MQPLHWEESKPVPYIDLLLIVALQQVVQDSSFIEVTEMNLSTEWKNGYNRCKRQA